MREADKQEKHVEKVLELIEEYNRQETQKRVSLVVDAVVRDAPHYEIEVVELNCPHLEFKILLEEEIRLTLCNIFPTKLSLASL